MNSATLPSVTSPNASRRDDVLDVGGEALLVGRERLALGHLRGREHERVELHDARSCHRRPRVFVRLMSRSTLCPGDTFTVTSCGIEAGIKCLT